MGSYRCIVSQLNNLLPVYFLIILAIMTKVKRLHKDYCNSVKYEILF